jgi:hypothetical protein
MKLITTFFAMLIIGITMSISAQNGPISTLGTVTTTGSTAVVPITVDNFINIKSCDLKIKYDPLIATPTGVSKGIGLDGSLTLNLSTPGVIKLIWNALTGSVSTLSNGSVLLNISFNKVGSGTSSLIFDETIDEYDCQFYDANYNELNDIPGINYYIPGSLTFNSQVSPITTAPILTACSGTDINVPVTVSGFNNIGAVSLTLNYDPAVLSFNSGSNTGNFPGLAIGGGSGTISIGGFSTDPDGFSLANGAVLCTLNFTSNGGTSALSWNDEDGYSCQYAGPLGEPDLNDTPQATYYINGSVESCQTKPTPTIVVGTITNPTTCGGNGTIPLTFTNVPNGTYTINYDGGSFPGIVVFSNAASISAPAGTYTNLKISVGSETSANGVNTTVGAPEAPLKPLITASGSTTICPDGSVMLTSSAATGNLWSTGESTQSIIISVAGSYTVTVTNAAGCSATSEATVVTVQGLPVSISLSATATEVCSGTYVVYTATPVNGGPNPGITWYINGNYSGYSSNSLTYGYPSPKNGDKIKCSVTSDAACVHNDERTATSNEISMVVNPAVPASVSIAAGANNICEGTQVTFTATPDGGGTPAFQWYVNNAAVGTGLASYTYTPGNGDQVKVVMTSSMSCATGNPATSNTVTMIVNPAVPASVSIAAGANNICEGTQVTFTATPDGGGTPAFQWYVNNAAVGTGLASYTYTPGNGDQVKVVMTSSMSCATGNPATSNTVTMIVNPAVPASVSIAAGANNICEGTQVTFTATPVGGGTPAYQWKVNNVNVGTGLASYTYTPVNGDQVKVVMTSSLACATGNPATSNTVTMIVNPAVPASVSIAAGANNICEGTQVTFTATPVGGGTPAYQWKVNNANVGTGLASYTYTPVNGDQVKVVMTSSLSCATGNPATSNTVTMIVNPAVPASVSIAAGANNICEGTQVTFTATPVGGGTPAYQWKVNNANVGTGLASYTYTPVNGDQVKVVMTSSLSCATGNPATSNTVTMIVNPELPVSVSIAASQNPVCFNTRVEFTATPTNGGSNPAYQWKVNGIDAGTNSDEYSYYPANDDVITCVLTSNASCKSGSPATSEPITMSVGSVVLSGVSLSAEPSGAVCEGTSVTFTATPEGGGDSPKYFWYKNDVMLGEESASYSYVPVNGDEIQVGMLSNSACADKTLMHYSDPITVTVNPKLPVSVSVSASSTEVCEGTSVTFTATPVNEGTAPLYQWLVNGAEKGTSDVELTYIPENGDVVTCVLTSNLTCISANPATSNPVMMVVNPAVAASVSITASANNICEGTQVTFTATPVGGGTPDYQWKVNNANVGTGLALYTYTPVNGDLVKVVMTSSFSCATGTPTTSNIIDLSVTSPGQWLGITSSDWDTESNWCGGVPTSSTNVSIPSGVIQPVIGVLSSASCNNINIADGAILTIESNASGTGSLIISGTVSGAGSAEVQRYMTTDAWHIVASPVSGQSISNFLSSNANVATDDDDFRGMMDYNPTINDWNNYFNSSTPGNMETGIGFSMRTNANSAVTFSGTLQSGNQTAVGLTPALWNCVGNPYTSAIGINQGSSSTTNFLTDNAANLDPSFGAIYVWDNLDANNGVWGVYTVISNAVTDAAFEVQQGQAFMVKMNTSETSVSFNSDMQIHNPGLDLKSTKGMWSSIKLQASVNSQRSSTTIAFNSAMTKGLDPTYDAGLLRGGSDLVLYSKLVEDNGIPFAVQALPDNDLGSMIVQLGVESKTGGEIVFSVESMNLPSTCLLILEDKQSHIFTDLSTDEYSTTIAANSSVSDRFRLHISNLNTKLDPGSLVGNLSAYAVRNIEIRIKGNVSNQAVATLYDVQGRIVLVKTLEEGSLNVVRTPNIKSAIYLLSVTDKGKLQRFKIPVNE